MIFCLQTDMNQIFKMRYYEALQTKELQSYKPSYFTKIRFGPWASLEHSNFSWKRQSIPNNFWPRTLIAHNFAENWHWKFCVRHSKDLIHTFLEPKDQDPSSTFKVLYFNLKRSCFASYLIGKETKDTTYLKLVIEISSKFKV